MCTSGKINTFYHPAVLPAWDNCNYKVQLKSQWQFFLMNQLKNFDETFFTNALPLKENGLHKCL